MPHFAVIARDKPGAEAARMAARAEHFAYIETILDRIAIAGPLKDADGRFLGSILIYDVADEGARDRPRRVEPHEAEAHGFARSSSPGSRGHQLAHPPHQDARVERSLNGELA